MASLLLFRRLTLASMAALLAGACEVRGNILTTPDSGNGAVPDGHVATPADADTALDSGVPDDAALDPDGALGLDGGIDLDAALHLDGGIDLDAALEPDAR